MTDADDWGLDVQLTLDVLAPEIYLEQNNVRPCTGGVGPGNARFHVANADLIFASAHPLPRLGGGSFARTTQTLFADVYKVELQYVSYGKPSIAAYERARQTLAKQASDLTGESTADVLFDKIYAIGDNPEVDIKGANDAEMTSILVRTGVFKGENDGANRAVSVYDNVAAAVEDIISLTPKT